MRNLCFTIAYDGRAYHGYQVQKNALTVAQVFQDGIEQVFESRRDIKGCSRTDAGVHANQFCISMQTESTIPCQRIPRALNRNLPPDISVLSCREVRPDFHARYSCLGKEYLYKLWNAPVRNPFLQGLALHYPYPLEVSFLDEAAKIFVGRHDFAGFCSSSPEIEDTVRTIFDFSVERTHDIIEFKVRGDGFLYHMVRILVGTLLEVGRGAIRLDQLSAALASGNRRQIGPTAAADGLYLNRVFYREEDFLSEGSLPSFG